RETGSEDEGENETVARSGHLLLRVWLINAAGSRRLHGEQATQNQFRIGTEGQFEQVFSCARASLQSVRARAQLRWASGSSRSEAIRQMRSAASQISSAARAIRAQR